MTKDLYDKLMVFGNDREPFLAHNFMRTTDLDDGTATVTLPMHTESLNRWGGAHGGILFSLCDVAMGMAIMTLRQEMVVTVNATIDYLSAAAAGSTLASLPGGECTALFSNHAVETPTPGLPSVRGCPWAPGTLSRHPDHLVLGMLKVGDISGSP